MRLDGDIGGRLLLSSLHHASRKLKAHIGSTIFVAPNGVAESSTPRSAPAATFFVPLEVNHSDA